MRTNRDKNGLSELQKKAIVALLQHPSVKAAAESIGIADRSIRRYMQEPAFAAAYEQAKQDISLELRGSLVALSDKAVEAIKDLLDGRGLVKFQAAKLVIDRVAPELPVAKGQDQPAEPGGLVSREILPYLTDEELSFIERTVQNALARRDAQKKMLDLDSTT